MGMHSLSLVITLSSQDHPPVMSGYFTTLANLLYYSSLTFFSLIEQASSYLQQNVGNLYEIYSFNPSCVRLKISFTHLLICGMANWALLCH